MKGKLLITGASGFVGGHLTEIALSEAYDVFGTVYGGSVFLDSLLPEDRKVEVNLLDRESVFGMVQRIQPDFVVHLAALSSPSKSIENATATYTNNISAQLNLLDALVKTNSAQAIIVVGSAEEYGLVDERDNPVTETTHLRPLNPYSVSKIAQDFMGLQYHLSHKLPIIRLRPFNHTGERQSEAFVVSAFAKQIAQLEQHGGGEMMVGNLETRRDFSDVKDIVRGYLMALSSCEHGEVYNIGSGQAVSIQTILDTLIGFSTTPIAVKQDPQRMRAHDVSVLACDYQKFSKATGWSPEIPLSTTLLRVLDYWRSKN